MKKQKNAKQTVDSIEAIKELPKEVKNTLFDQAGKDLLSDLWSQMLGTETKSSSLASEANKRGGDLNPGQEIDLKQEIKAAVEPAINYVREIIHAEKKVQVEDQRETKARIQEILIEIKKITVSSKELAIEFKDVEKLDTIPANAGKYHTNFVEWVLSMIVTARKRVESAVNWTQAMKGKKNQKQYWSLFKKHGTSFGLSGERVVATQVG